MAKKVLLQDLNNVEILPITRGELILDSSGKKAFHSNEFLATTSLPGLMSAEDKNKLDNFSGSGVTYDLVSATTDGLAPKIGTEAAATVTAQADEWVLTSTKGATPTWRKLPINAFLNYYRPILVNGTSLLGNDNTALNIVAGTNINLTTDEGKVTINNALTKLSQLTNDSGYLTNDSLDNYVTLNTDLTITGFKTFILPYNTKFILGEPETPDIKISIDVVGGWARGLTLQGIQGDNAVTATFGVKGDTKTTAGYNTIDYLYLAHLGQNYKTATFKVYDNSATVLNNIVLHAGNYNNYAPTLDGIGATGNWDINIRGWSAYLRDNSTKNTEVKGSLQIHHGHLTPYGDDVDEWNSPYGEYDNNGVKVDYGSILRVRYSPEYYHDLWFDANLGSISFRQIINNVSWGWKTLLDSNNFSKYLNDSYVKKTGDVISGLLGFSSTTYPHIYGNGHFLVLGGKNSTAASVVIEYGNNVFRPYANNVTSLGTDNMRWLRICSQLGNFSGQITSTVADGTAPFVVASKTLVKNLNSQFWRGNEYDYEVYSGTTTGSKNLIKLWTFNTKSAYNLAPITFKYTLRHSSKSTTSLGTVNIHTLQGRPNKITVVGDSTFVDSFYLYTIQETSSTNSEGAIEYEGSHILYLKAPSWTAGKCWDFHYNPGEIRAVQAHFLYGVLETAPTTYVRVVQSTIGSFYADITGNANTATKLQTARKLWGNDFDGSSDISGPILIKSSGISSSGIATSYTDCWTYRINDNDGTTIKDYIIPHYGYSIKWGRYTHTNGTDYTSIGSFLSDYFGLNFHIGATNYYFRFMCSSSSSLITSAKLYGSGTLQLRDALLTGGKIAHNDEKAGAYIGADGTMHLARSNAGPVICFHYNNAVVETSTLSEVSSGKLKASGLFESTGFVRTGSSDSYVLLGGGGHKALSDFMMKSDELTNNLTTITKELTVTQDWMDTGISGTDLATGTYIVRISGGDLSNHFWNCSWSGIFSWYSYDTNDSESDEIILHRAGHAYNNTLYLRTLQTPNGNGGAKLLIAANKNLTANTYTFKFKRII